MAAKSSRKWKEIKEARLSAKQLEQVANEVRRELLEMDLRELRESVGVTQVQLAAEAQIAQSELSKIERRDDHLLSTLRRYVKALGGEIEVVAVLDNKRITLRGV